MARKRPQRPRQPAPNPEPLPPVGSDPKRRTRPLSPAFRWTFSSVVALTVLSLGVSLYLVHGPQPMPEETRGLLQACLFTWKMGFGAILGLIGGKAIP